MLCINDGGVYWKAPFIYSFEACGITNDDPDHIHGWHCRGCTRSLKDLDESLLDVDTNCEDADEDSDCDDNEEIDI